MSTSNPKVNVPAEMPPEAPAELLAKRDKLVADLEAAAKSATGTQQQVMRKMATLLGSTKQGAPFDPQLFQDVKDAFQRYAQDPEASAKPQPAILMQSVEWMQNYLSSRGFAVQGAPASAPAATAAPAPARGGKDSFESGASQKARAITGDVPPPPAGQPAPPADKQQQDLESFKTWMKNPGLGKVKG
ncbi:hypothetical protein [Vitiosangium sp. GDMCC 1.1324]|uniref:hypothetical protein n=1 Tax=Vitiosangium sp. (strain GDMCC 1.1324) TaxID=2138576 RepID=UPI000D3AC5DC|nr:hypothetical protein [Vitiosangium sp. GDMCC 1.1324]PTL80499.1 hypothetical protein DAT35_28095 [Vitiosangium sp. GDMCC 1.1324]